jgi:hypothetical protein
MKLINFFLFLKKTKEISTIDCESKNMNSIENCLVTYSKSKGNQTSPSNNMQNKSTSKILIEKIDNSSKIQEDLVMIDENQENHFLKKKDIAYLYETNAALEIEDPFKSPKSVLSIESSNSISSESSIVPINEKAPLLQKAAFNESKHNEITITNVDNALTRSQSKSFNRNASTVSDLDQNKKSIVKQATLQKTVTFTTIYIFEEYYDPVKKKTVRKHLEKNKTKTVHTDHKFYQILENYQPNSIQFPKKNSSSKIKTDESSSSRSSSVDSFYSAESNSNNKKSNKKTTDESVIKKSSPAPRMEIDEIVMNINEIKIEPEIIEENDKTYTSNEKPKPSSSYSNRDVSNSSSNNRSYAKKCTNRRNYLSNRYAEDNLDNNEYIAVKNLSTAKKKRSKSTITSKNKRRKNSSNNLNDKNNGRKRAFSTSSVNSSNKIAVTQPFNFNSLKIKLTGEKPGNYEKNSQFENNKIAQNQQAQVSENTNDLDNQQDNFQDQNDSFIINNDLMLSNSTNKENATKSWLIQHGHSIQQSTISSNANNNSAPQVFEDFLTNFNVGNLMNENSVFMNETYPGSFVQNEVVIGYEEENDNNSYSNNIALSLSINTSNNNDMNNNESNLFKKFKLEHCRVDLKDITLKYPELLNEKRVDLSKYDESIIFKTPKSNEIKNNSKIQNNSSTFSSKSNKSNSARSKLKSNFLNRNTTTKEESFTTPKTPVRRSTRKARQVSNDTDLIILSETNSTTGPDSPSSQLVVLPSSNTRNKSTLKRKSSQLRTQTPSPVPLIAKKTSSGSISSRVSLTPAQSTTSNRNMPFQYKFKENENVFAKYIDGNYYPALISKIIYAVEPKSKITIEYYNVNFIQKTFNKKQQKCTNDFIYPNDQLIPIDVLDKNDPVLILDGDTNEYNSASFLSYSFENNSKMDRPENLYLVSCKKTGMIKPYKLEKISIHKRNAELMLKRFKDSFLDDLKQKESRNDYYAFNKENHGTDEESDNEYATKSVKKNKKNDYNKNSKTNLTWQRSDNISTSEFEEEINTSRRSSLSLTTCRAVSTSKSNDYFVSYIKSMKKKSLFVDTYNLNIDFSEKISDFRKKNH